MKHWKVTCELLNGGNELFGKLFLKISQVVEIHHEARLASRQHLADELHILVLITKATRMIEVGFLNFLSNHHFSTNLFKKISKQSLCLQILLTFV